MQAFIQSSLDYIEHNLKADISIEELAQIAGYSLGHYCRIFTQEMGVTVAAYILKRRLDHALAEIKSKRKAIEVVLEYGFDTYAGFYKAFVKMYGCSPKKYLSIYKESEVLFLHDINEIKKILENWEISSDSTIENITHTQWETQEESEWKTWKIGSEYYLKTNERSKMIRNINIAKALYKQGLSSEFLPISTKQGEDYLDGEHIFLLTGILGEPLNTSPLTDEDISRLENNELRENHANKLGQAIARLHKALKSIQGEVKPNEGNLYEQGEKAIPIVKGLDLGISEGFFNDFIENFNILHEKLPKQLIHGNLTGDTAVYENGEVIGFKGFEIYNLSFPRIYDITWGAGELTYQPTIDVYLNTLKEMLKGYDSINPLSSDEKQSVYYIICATYLKGIAYYTQVESELIADLIARSGNALVYLSKNKESFNDLL
ncbi:MAG: helix-turn-helix domain-containing protein [Oscillospiraceae bacterium]|nr:helix-turn-helix domain-containing protein [Oscillospiraceae bacterium]